MIYTVTFNPALDYVVKVPDFQVGQVNRIVEEQMEVGGKGINVSSVLKRLGVDNCALGFVAGFTGREILRLLDEEGITHKFIEVEEGLSRINMKLKSEVETEINGIGPYIHQEALNKLYVQLDALQEGDFLVLAGSIPSMLQANTYEMLIKRVVSSKVEVIVDATKDLLIKALPYRPFLIKPNHHELSELFSVALETRDEILVYAKKLQDMGARNVIVSRGDKGAILLTEQGEVVEALPIEGQVKNTVGAGDSMVAGFLAGYLEQKDIKEALKWGLAAGSATAFSNTLGTKEEILSLLKSL
nr:1-phosphofructokinase [uncultured Niameybacter sp.]